MRVALAFFGITRSLKYVINTIETNIFDILSKAGIVYETFIHTYSINGEYVNIRAKETHAKVNNDEYKLLNAKYVQVDDQDEIKNKLNLEQYRSKPDPWKTNYNSVDNFIIAQYSKMKVTSMISSNSSEPFDFIIYLRPDVSYLNELSINFLKLCDDHQICIPDFHKYGPYRINDRFAICNMNNYKIYGNIFDQLLHLSRIMPLHSETIIGKLLLENQINIKYIRFRFQRIRIDGRNADLKIKP